MTKRLVVLGATLAIVATFAAVGLAGQGRESVTPGHPRISVEAHRVGHPSASVSTVAGKKALKKVVYVETPVFATPPAGGFTSLTCPKKSSAVSGYFGSDGGILTDYNALGPNGVRDWDFGLINIAGADVATFLGVACIK